MDLTTFEIAEKIVSQMRELDKEHEAFQDIISDTQLAEIEIVTTKGSVKFSNPARVNNIVSTIDGLLWREEEKLEERLSKL